jgi:hypothetical protein
VEEFGSLLSYYRGKSVDPIRGKPLTQERVAELLEQVSGLQYAGATISNWERGASQINANDRPILVGLVKVFYDCQSLTSPDEADRLLATGNYRHLNEAELEQVFGNCPATDPAETGTAGTWRLSNGSGLASHQVLLDSLKELLAHPGKQLLAALRLEAPSQATWPAFLESLLAKLLGHWTATRLLWTIAWIAVWLATWWLTFPLLRWPGENQSQLQLAAIGYAIGALVMPLFIGLLVYHARVTNLREKQGKRIAAFFNCLGALAGFHLAYTLMLAARLLAFHLDLSPATVRLEIALAAVPVILAFTAAQQMPFHVRRAFGALQVTGGDHATLALLLLYPPILGIALVLVYRLLLIPHITVPLILATISLMALLARSRPFRGQSILPFLFPVLFILYFSLQAPSLLNITILAGLGTGVLLALWRNQLKMSLPAMLILLLLAAAAAFFFHHNLAPLGQGATAALVLLGGWLQWQQSVHFPPRFIALIAAAAGAVLFVRQGWYDELPVAVVFLALTLVYVWLDWRESVR